MSLQPLLQNSILVSAVLAWAIGQLLKTLIYAVMNRQLNFARLFGDGGMPSCHSASVTAMAVASAVHYGFGSAAFGITTMLAIIVMHDAMGVRLETGKQAKILNDILNLSPQEQLKELVGHTPLQVIMGALLGLTVSLIYNLS